MNLLKKIMKFSIFFIIIAVILYFGIYFYASTTDKLDINSASGYYMYDNNNQLINGSSDEWVTLNNISPYLKDATIAIEDKNFYNHKGFDYLRIFKSLYINLINRKNLQGASTISQQLVKNLFLDFDKTWERKLKEAWLTVRIESQYSKDEILEGYLNTINYGGVYGIENASHYYFNKDSKDLTLAEASMLAGIPKSPSNYSPITNEKKAKERQKKVLDSMVSNGYITKEEMNKALGEELSYYGYTNKNELSTLMYYKDAVMQELNNIDSIPISFLETGGLKIYTNLDIEAQTILENSMKDNITTDDLQIASIMMDPRDGSIIALTGGRDYNKSQYNRATSAKRQVGSTLKPFLYYAALENGFTPSTTFTSEETTFMFSNNQTYKPSNYNNQYANKPISMAAAISFSDNIYAVKTHLFLGEETLVNLLNRVGINERLDAIPSLALGSQELNIISLTSAYSTLANEGYKIKGHLISRVEDMNGNILYEYKNKPEQVLNSSLVYIINQLLTSTYDYNFIDYTYPTCYDLTDKLHYKYAIKTGTTNTDNLIFGYNKNIVVSIWSGYDDNRDTEGTEGKQIRNMWADIVESYLKDKDVKWYDKPNNVTGVLVNSISGEPAKENDSKATLFYYIKGTQPSYDDALDSLIPTVKINEEAIDQ